MEEKELNLEEIFTTLRNRKRTILISILLFVIITFFYNNHKTPLYKATSRVRLPGSNSINITNLQGITTPWNDVPTQLAILKSFNIRKRVIEKLQLAIRFIDSAPPVHIDSLKISTDIRKGFYTITVNRDSTYRIMPETSRIPLITGKIGKWSQNHYIGLFIILKNGAHLPCKCKIQIRNINSLLRNIGGKIKIQQEGRSFIAKIEATDYSPEFAKKLADAYAEAYVDYTLEDARFSAKVLKDFLQAQVIRIESQLKAKEDSLSSLEKKLDYFTALLIKDGDKTSKELLSKYLDLVSEKYDAEIKKYEARSMLSAIYKKFHIQPDSVMFNANIEGLKTQLLKLEKQRASLLILYSPNHPAIKALTEEIHEIQKEIGAIVSQKSHKLPASISPTMLSLIENSTVNQLIYDARASAIEGILKKYEKRLSRMPEVSIEYFNLKRKIEALKEIYQNLLLKLEETKIEHASQIPDARILDYALIPKSPVSPNKTLNFYFAIILGTFVGVIIALIEEHLDKTLKDPELAERLIEAPIISVVPHVDTQEPIIPPLGNCHNERFLESLNRIRINIEFLKKINSPLKIIGITSATSGEGKTIISLNLSQVLALSGYKVLLVNADLIKTKLNKLMNVSKENKGFAEFLQGDETVPHIITTPLKNLHFLPSGEKSRYLSSYLFKENAAEKFKNIAKEYDYVIFDTAPVGVVSNTLMFANYLFDGIILVLRYNLTNTDFLKAVIKELKRNNVKIIGGIFNDFRTKGKGAERYYYYGYYYQENKSPLLKRLHKLLKKRCD